MTDRTARHMVGWIPVRFLLALLIVAMSGGVVADDGPPPATGQDATAERDGAGQDDKPRVLGGPAAIIQVMPIPGAETPPSEITPGAIVVEVGEDNPPTIYTEAVLIGEEGEDANKQLQELMRQAQEAQRREEEQLRKALSGPEWQPTHRQKSVIAVKAALHTFCLNNDGNILAGCGGPSESYVEDSDSPDGYRIERTSGDAEIRVYSPEGSLLKTWKVDIKPEAIAVAKDGTIFVGGDGQVARLDQTGEVLAVTDSPVVAVHKQETQKEEAEPADGEEAESEVAETERDQPPKKSAFRALFDLVLGSNDDVQVELEVDQAAQMEQRIREVNAIAVTEQDVFVVCPMREGYGFAIWRTDHELQNPERIVTKLRGCCGQMDISAYEGDVFVCENSRKRVTQYDRTGKTIAHFGKSSRSGPDGFGSCCNPMNLCFGANGDVITSESGPPDAVKRFTQDGELVSVVALPDFEGGCLRVSVAISPDERTVYVLNTSENSIHVFADRRYEPTHKQVTEIQFKSNGKPAGLHTFCCTPDGKLLAACGGTRMSYVRTAAGTEAQTIEESSEIRVVSLDGETIDRWPVDFMPQSVNVAPNGTVFVGGEGSLAKLSPTGDVLLTADTPTKSSMKELMANIDEVAAERKKQYEEQAKRYTEMADKIAAQLTEGKLNGKELTAADKQRLQQQQRSYKLYAGMMEQQKSRAKEMAIASAKRKLRVSGVAVTEKDVFVCCSAVEGYGFDIYRMNHDLAGAVKIVEGLRGCCGQMDIQAFDGKVYAAENSRGRVVGFDRDGKEVTSWGSKDRKSVEGWGSCCNPMNLRFDAAGVVYTSEASLGRIKRFTADGKFLGLVGTADVVPGCKNVAVGASPDGKKVFLLDITRSQITVLEQTPEPAAGAVAEESESSEDIEVQIQPPVLGGVF